MASRSINDKERQGWVAADPELALMWAESRLGMRDFIYSNRDAIDAFIRTKSNSISAQGWGTPPPAMLTVPLPTAGRPKGGKGKPRKRAFER